MEPVIHSDQFPPAVSAVSTSHHRPLPTTPAKLGRQSYAAYATIFFGGSKPLPLRGGGRFLGGWLNSIDVGMTKNSHNYSYKRTREKPCAAHIFARPQTNGSSWSRKDSVPSAAWSKVPQRSLRKTSPVQVFRHPTTLQTRKAHGIQTFMDLLRISVPAGRFFGHSTAAHAAVVVIWSAGERAWKRSSEISRFSWQLLENHEKMLVNQNLPN